MMKLKYLRIAYCIFALMPVVASAADEQNEEITVTVYYGNPQNHDQDKKEWKYKTSRQVTFSEETVTGIDFVKKSWEAYVEGKVSEEGISKDLTSQDICKDFNLLTDDQKIASEIFNTAAIVARIIIKGNGEKYKRRYYRSGISLKKFNNRILFIEYLPEEEYEKDAKLLKEVNEYKQEILLSNLIEAENKRRRKNRVNQNSQNNQEIQNDKKWSKIKENPIYITIGGGGTLAIIGVLLYTINKYKSKEPRKKKGAVTKKANDAKGKRQIVL